MLFCEVLLGTHDPDSGNVIWSKMGSNLNHSTLSLLSSVFSILDGVVQQHDAFKVETIGSEYMAVSGKPTHTRVADSTSTTRLFAGFPASARHPANTAITMLGVAVAMLDAIESNPALKNVTLQIGINSGTAVETILGRELLPRWKLFGDTVNTASRMKSFGAPGCIHVSERVRQQAMRPVVAAWKRIDPHAVKRWQSINKHAKRFMDGTGAGSDVQLREIEPTDLDMSVPELLGFKFDHRPPQSIKGKGQMHTHFVHVCRPSKLLRPPTHSHSAMLKQSDAFGIARPDGRWLSVPPETVLTDAAMAASIRALMVDELQRLVLTVDHTSARNLTMIGNGSDTASKPPPIIQSSRASQILPSVSNLAELDEPEQKHKAALVGLRFMRMLSLADTKTGRSNLTVSSTQATLPGIITEETSNGSSDTSPGPRLPYTASSISMRDTDTLIGRRPTLAMQESDASFVVPVTEDTQFDTVLGAGKFLASQRSLNVGDQKGSSQAGLSRDERKVPRVKSFSVQRANKAPTLKRSSSEKLAKSAISKSFRHLVAASNSTSPVRRLNSSQRQAASESEEASAASASVLDENQLAIQPQAHKNSSYDILAGDLHKRIRATPEEMSNAIPMPILHSKTLYLKKTAATELERLFLHYLTGDPNHYLRGCLAIVTSAVAFVFVHTSSMMKTTFGIFMLGIACFIAAVFATASLLVHMKKLPCPLLWIMPKIRRKLHKWTVNKLDDRQLAAVVAQHIYGAIVLFLVVLHYSVMLVDGVACRVGGCSTYSQAEITQDHTAYHHAAFHHIILMILSETLRFRFLQLSATTGVLVVVAAVSLFVDASPATPWAIGWIILNSGVALLLARSNERRRRSDFFLGYVSDEGSKETLNMLYAMLPQAIAKPLLNSVSIESDHFRGNGLLDDDATLLCCIPAALGADDLMMARPPIPPAIPPAASEQAAEAHSSLYEPSTQLVSLLMFDLVGFTKLSAAIGPHKLVTMLDRLYASFDRIVRRRQAYKVETIGDAFLVSCGAPEVMPPEESAVIVAKCAIEMLRRVRSFTAPGGHILQARIGIHLGRVMAGVISSHMPRYQVFGTEVDRVMLMESSGQPGRVHASDSILAHIASAPDLQVVETLPDGTGFVERDRSAAAFAPW